MQRKNNDSRPNPTVKQPWSTTGKQQGDGVLYLQFCNIFNRRKKKRTTSIGHELFIQNVKKTTKKATKVLPVNCKRMTDCWCMTCELSLSKKLKGYKVKGRSRTGSGQGKNLWTFYLENERLLKQRVLGTQQPQKSNSSLFCQIDCHYTAAQLMLSPSRHFPQALYPVIQCDICTLMLRDCVSVCVRVCRYLTHVYSLLAWY